MRNRNPIEDWIEIELQLWELVNVDPAQPFTSLPASWNGSLSFQFER